MTYTTSIVEIRNVAEGTSEVVFLRPENFVYKAGQYIQIAVPKLNYADPKGVCRVFSLTSHPDDPKVLSVLFRNSGSGFKKTLLEIPIGTNITIEGPMGKFVYPEGSEKHHVYIAGGVGIAPFLSMIEYNQSCKACTHTTLLYANRSFDTAAYCTKLKNISNTQQWFTLEEIYGKIELEVIRSCFQKNKDALWFVVGPPLMVTEVESLLHRIGVSDAMIRVESFTGY